MPYALYNLWDWRMRMITTKTKKLYTFLTAVVAGCFLAVLVAGPATASPGALDAQGGHIDPLTGYLHFHAPPSGSHAYVGQSGLVQSGQLPAIPYDYVTATPATALYPAGTAGNFLYLVIPLSLLVGILTLFAYLRVRNFLRSKKYRRRISRTRAQMEETRGEFRPTTIPPPDSSRIPQEVSRAPEADSPIAPVREQIPHRPQPLAASTPSGGNLVTLASRAPGQTMRRFPSGRRRLLRERREAFDRRLHG